jgi:hypothetical protein
MQMHIPVVRDNADVRVIDALKRVEGGGSYLDGAAAQHNGAAEADVYAARQASRRDKGII